ncbi:MAG TPA: hypothetical protein PKN96_04675 [Flavobacterium sp.]|uniref:hypothetical protein n=1 Tax=Flavobacterium sp. TaxID=239 RepID=UPI002C9010C1|nr:hypothetical protein [Flavobacterium sp.]HNP32563.1 hypothetical protein [Flavobacterium sp.]
MKKILTQKNLIYALLVISFVSALRGMFFPLASDEIQYAEIGKNIVTKGQYSLFGQPSTFTPTLPFLVALFYFKSMPTIGFIFVRIFNLLLMVIGLKFCFSFLKKINIPTNISLLIILLSATNNVIVTWCTAIYPESILFCFFWMFLYYVIDRIESPKQILYFIIPLFFLIITRYLYGVFLLIAGFYILEYLIRLFNQSEYKTIYKVIVISFICLVPLLLWFKYVLSVENEVYLDQSYFKRFKDNDIFYNIKCGLGIIKHDEAMRINGIPAFISLFVPMTGLRNWIVSLGLIFIFSYGFFTKWKVRAYRTVALAVFLVMLGLIFAGTGFSRYWLVLLPACWIGFYLFYTSLKVNEKYFEKLALILSVVYVVNELRIDYMLLNKL